MRNALNLAFVVLLLAGMSTSTTANAAAWPQEIEADEGTIVVYQPQPERLEGNTLAGRSAMSLELKGRDEPIFGAFWFEARIDTDRDKQHRADPRRPRHRGSLALVQGRRRATLYGHRGIGRPG